RTHTAIDPLCELLLYGADRAQHYAQIIRPALKNKQVVLCDRFSDATIAYQEGGHQLPPEWILRLNLLATQGLKPHLTFLIDCPVEVGLQRARKRARQSGDTEDRFEQMELEFHRRVRRRYLELAENESSRFVVLDGTKAVSVLQEEIWEKVK